MFFLLLTSFNIFAFDSSYESVSSYDDRTLAGVRDIYNAPYSFCRNDGLSDDLCDSVSLKIGGDTFKRVYIDQNVADKSLNYFSHVNESTLWSITNNYKLENQNKFGVPTLGQLDHMIVNGLVPKGVASGYWFWSTLNNKAKIAYPKNSNADNDNTAMIMRLVSSSYPSSCDENDCNYFKDNEPWTLQSGSLSSFTVRTNWGYRINGRDFSWRKTWRQAKHAIPAGATNVWMEIWHDGAPGYSGRFYNIENQRGMSPVVCIRQRGSLFVTGADLLREWCW